MRILMVYSHPVAESFGASMRDAALMGLHEAGHEVKLIDLYEEEFEPRLSRQERLDYEDQTKNTVNVLDRVEKLQWAEGLVFVFPTWWYGLPAMLSGWFDRVWVPGVAFKIAQSGKVIEPNLRNIELVAGITSCGSPWWWMKLMGEPQRRIIMRGLAALFSKGCKKKWLAIYNMDSASPEARGKYLAKIAREMRSF
jgi:NAD(P)H dehydrogenase (quinone)